MVIFHFLEDDLFLKFKIWERGSVGIEELQQFLVADVRKALSDIFLEFFILFTPISEVPSNLQPSYFPKGHSRSSQTTTPSSIRNESLSATPVSSAHFPKLAVKKFLSEPATPAELRARSPIGILRNRSLNEIPVKEPLSAKTSKELQRDIAKKSQVDTMENIEKTYETLEEYFPLNPSESRSSSIKRAENDGTVIKELSSGNSDRHAVSVREVERFLPAADQSLGSPHEALIDKEVEESFTCISKEPEMGVKEVSEKRELTWKEIEMRKRHEKENRRFRRRFERGDVGFLHPW